MGWISIGNGPPSQWEEIHAAEQSNASMAASVPSAMQKPQRSTYIFTAASPANRYGVILIARVRSGRCGSRLAELEIFAPRDQVRVVVLLEDADGIE